MASLEDRFKAFLKKHDRFKRHSFEQIPEADYNCASKLLEKMMLNTKEDYLLFFSCLVVLNAKNKTVTSHKLSNYSFKNLVAVAIESAIENDVDFLQFDRKKDPKGRPVVYVNLLGVQFSFHYVPFTPKMKFAKTAKLKQYKEQEWELIPFQKASKTLFNYAIEQENLSRLQFDATGLTPRQLLTIERRKVKKQQALKNAKASKSINKNLENALEDNKKAEKIVVTESELNNEGQYSANKINNNELVD